ncbi:MAG: hypothetical protein LBT47_03570, partial [Deltaproteobacteria bacterium]|nr:hypothetical protein [Deltaproteobacteria bacterium]
MALEYTRRFNEKELPDVASLRSDAETIFNNIKIGNTLSMKPDRAEKKPRPVTMRKSRFCAIAQPFLKSFVRLWAQ